MEEEQHLGAVAAVQLGGPGAEQRGGAVAALQLGCPGAEQQGGAVAAVQLGGPGAEQRGGAVAVLQQREQRRRRRWVKQESKAMVTICTEMMKSHGLNRMKPRWWPEVAGRLDNTKNSSTWNAGSTPKRTVEDCRIKFHPILQYCRRRPQLVNGKEYEFGDALDPLGGVALDDNLLDAVAADGEDLQGPLGAAAEDDEAAGDGEDPQDPTAAEAVNPVPPVAGGPLAAPPAGEGLSSPPPWSSTETYLLIILFPEAKRESNGKPWRVLSAKLARMNVNRTGKECKRRIKKLIKHNKQQTVKDQDFFPAVEAMQMILHNRSFDLNQ